MPETVKKPPTQTPAQQRARDALEKVTAVREKDFAGDYCSYVEALPAVVLMNGLGQAAAMLLAKANGEGGKKEAYRNLYEHLSKWLCESPLAPYTRSKDLLEGITNNGQDQYLLAEAEALAYLEWLKKFAVAFIEKKENAK